MENAKFQFQASKKIQGEDGFPGAVKAALGNFTAQVPNNLRRGDATVTAVVATPMSGAYFGIVLAGPFSSLEALQAALAQVTSKEELIAQMKRLDIS
jgi:hypothetical protein